MNFIKNPQDILLIPTRRWTLSKTPTTASKDFLPLIQPRRAWLPLQPSFYHTLRLLAMVTGRVEQ